MAVARAARRFKSDSSKRPRELNLRCIDSLCATCRPREAEPSRNGSDDDAAPGSAGCVPTGWSGCDARNLHFISNGCLREEARRRARSRSKSNGLRRRRPFGRFVAAAAKCAAARFGGLVAPPCFGAPAGVRDTAPRAGRPSSRAACPRVSAGLADAHTVARMRRPLHASTGFRAPVAAGLAPRDTHHPIRVAALAERARAA